MCKNTKSVKKDPNGRLFHRHTALVGNACCLQDLFTLDSERGRGNGLIEEVSKRAKASLHVYN